MAIDNSGPVFSNIIERATAYYTQKLVERGVPEHLHDGLVLYLTAGIPPGHFLTAVLENNLSEAMGRADETSRAGLYSIVVFLHNDVPMSAWGSPAKVNQWLKTFESKS